MTPFVKFQAPAFVLPMVNVDTDMIIPKQFLKTLKRTGLGEFLFFEIRYNEDGSVRQDFALNDEKYKNGCLLITGKNFGCGSSREHAPWALNDFGIRCVIAPSFADIFYNNCFKNGMLPLVLSEEKINDIANKLEDHNNCEVCVDLEACSITVLEDNTLVFQDSFSVDESRRNDLLGGLDDIARTFLNIESIQNFEQKRKSLCPWL